MPDVILNHERVANHYLLPSVNLASEIAARMRSGEFTWEQFGGTHPNLLGHAYYAATINKVLDEMYALALLPKMLPSLMLFLPCHWMHIVIQMADWSISGKPI